MNNFIAGLEGGSLAATQPGRVERPNARFNSRYRGLPHAPHIKIHGRVYRASAFCARFRPRAMPDYLVYAIVLSPVALAVYFILRHRSPRKYKFSDEPFTLPSAWYLFTPTERAFLHALDWASGEHYRVFGKVRLEDIVPELRRKPDSFISWQSASLMHVDFVLCDKEDLRVVACIELDDGSHYHEDVKRRDAMKNMVIKAAGIPLVGFQARASYESSEVKERLLAALPVGK